MIHALLVATNSLPSIVGVAKEGSVSNSQMNVELLLVYKLDPLTTSMLVDVPEHIVAEEPEKKTDNHSYVSLPR